MQGTRLAVRMSDRVHYQYSFPHLGKVVALIDPEYVPGVEAWLTVESDDVLDLGMCTEWYACTAQKCIDLVGNAIAGECNICRAKRIAQKRR